jgi:two-component system sensor histidine kinase VicK
MFKSLRMRIVLILTLLIASVMVVVGTFLINSVSSFYNDDFSRQMREVFTTKEFIDSLNVALLDKDPSENLYEILNAFSGKIGIDSYRDFYILKGDDGSFLRGSNSEVGKQLERTPNLIRAMTGNVGQKLSQSASYYDYAYPVGSGENSYIIYIKDTKVELQEMIWVLFAIIVQALFFGLVIAGGMSFFLAKAITNPVENITKGAKQMAQGEFTYKLPVGSKDEIGTLTQTFNSMADVLKNTMDKMSGERNKLETIFLYLADGVLAFTKEGSLLHINNSAISLLGIEPEIGDSFDSLFYGFKLNIGFQDILQTQKGDMIILEIHTKGKVLEIYFARFDVENVGDNVLAGGVIAVIHDITQIRRLDDSRREFVANVSHELRTPLTSIRSYTETVLENPDLPEELRHKFLGVVMYESDRMTRIVKDLLVLARLDNKKMDWVFVTFPMKELLDNVYDSMLMDAQNYGHKLQIFMSEDLGFITGDRERIEQVIINIISNAIKYTPENGTISLVAKRRDGKIIISVTDNGIGIPKEDLPRLFERFYRVDKARSRERGGTGLGLAIAKEIVDAHHGTIEVESELDHGTTMTIILPCEQDGLGE